MAYQTNISASPAPVPRGGTAAEVNLSKNQTTTSQLVPIGQRLPAGAEAGGYKLGANREVLGYQTGKTAEGVSYAPKPPSPSSQFLGTTGEHVGFVPSQAGIPTGAYPSGIIKFTGLGEQITITPSAPTLSYSIPSSWMAGAFESRIVPIQPRAADIIKQQQLAPFQPQVVQPVPSGYFAKVLYYTQDFKGGGKVGYVSPQEEYRVRQMWEPIIGKYPTQALVGFTTGAAQAPVAVPLLAITAMKYGLQTPALIGKSIYYNPVGFVSSVAGGAALFSLTPSSSASVKSLSVTKAQTAIEPSGIFTTTLTGKGIIKEGISTQGVLPSGKPITLYLMPPKEYPTTFNVNIKGVSEGQRAISSSISEVTIKGQTPIYSTAIAKSFLKGDTTLSKFGSWVETPKGTIEYTGRGVSQPIVKVMSGGKLVSSSEISATTTGKVGDWFGTTKLQDISVGKTTYKYVEPTTPKTTLYYRMTEFWRPPSIVAIKGTATKPAAMPKPTAPIITQLKPTAVAITKIEPATISGTHLGAGISQAYETIPKTTGLKIGLVSPAISQKEFQALTLKPITAIITQTKQATAPSLKITPTTKITTATKTKLTTMSLTQITTPTTTTTTGVSTLIEPIPRIGIEFPSPQTFTGSPYIPFMPQTFPQIGGGADFGFGKGGRLPKFKGFGKVKHEVRPVIGLLEKTQTEAMTLLPARTPKSISKFKSRIAAGIPFMSYRLPSVEMQRKGGIKPMKWRLR